jgi:cell division septation protein DedD
MNVARIALLSLALAGSAAAQGTRPLPSLSPNTPPAPPAGPGSGASDELADPKTGCKIVRADNEPNISITWSGECYHGLAHGQGTLQWYQAGKPIARYEGEMKDGLANGSGKISYANGRTASVTGAASSPSLTARATPATSATTNPTAAVPTSGPTATAMSAISATTSVPDAARSTMPMATATRATSSTARRKAAARGPMPKVAATTANGATTCPTATAHATRPMAGATPATGRMAVSARASAGPPSASPPSNAVFNDAGLQCLSHAWPDALVRMRRDLRRAA